MKTIIPKRVIAFCLESTMSQKVQKCKAKNKIKREERDEWEFATLPFCQSKFLKVSKYQSFKVSRQKFKKSDTATQRHGENSKEMRRSC